MNCTKYNKIKQKTLRDVQLQHIRHSQNMRLYRKFFILKTSMRVKFDMLWGGSWGVDSTIDFKNKEQYLVSSSM